MLKNYRMFGKIQEQVVSIRISGVNTRKIAFQVLL